MYDIRIYDFEFNLLHIEPQIISANWTVKYNEIGTFEGHFDQMGDIVPICLDNKYLVVVQGNYQAIVTGKQIDGNEFILYGRTVNWILSRRVVPNFVSSHFESLNIEKQARQLVSESFFDVDNFVLGEVIGDSLEGYFWRNTYNALSDVIADCLDNAKLGHNVVFDRKRKAWVFNVLKGQKRDILVSVGNRNAYEMEYAEDLQEYYTSGFYEKPQDADEDGNVPESEWFEVEKDSKKGIYKWECVLSEQDESSARATLNKKVWSKDISTKTHDLVCGKDYNIGDIVRVQIVCGKYRKTAQKRIIGVNVWFENNNIGEEPIFEETNSD